MMPRKIVAMILAAFLAGGCGTANNLNMIPMGQSLTPMSPYGGVAEDIRELRNPSSNAGGRIASAVDLPFSAVADTLTLPWTISQIKATSESSHLRDDSTLPKTAVHPTFALTEFSDNVADQEQDQDQDHDGAFLGSES